MGIFIYIVVTINYALFSIFQDDKEAHPMEVFLLETTIAATSGFLVPVNAYVRNQKDGHLSEQGYKNDLNRYAQVYNDGLYKHPIALVLGDIVGSIFSILSAIALFFALRSVEEWGAFKIMFWTEIAEETLYYINVYRMTNEVDIGPIDIGVTLIIALIVSGLAEYARKKRMKNRGT